MNSQLAPVTRPAVGQFTIRSGGMPEGRRSDQTSVREAALMAQGAENGTAESVPAHQFARLRRGTSPTEWRISREYDGRIRELQSFQEAQ